MVRVGNFQDYKICYKERLVGVSSCWKADGIYRFDHSSLEQSSYNFRDYFEIGRVCDAYYKCNVGTITIVKCANGTVFHMDSGACKPGNSSLPNSCQLYCNTEKTGIEPFPVNVEECPYPLQFSETTGRCENFDEVYCGSRKEEKYICMCWFSKLEFTYIVDFYYR